jgi:hypothetical protein
LVLLMGSTFLVLAHAQVFKCTGPNGKTVYTDAPCGKRLDDEVLRGNTLNGGPRLRDLPREPAASHRAVAQGVCPSTLEVKNIATAATSMRYPPGSPEHEFLKDEVQRAAACKPAFTSYSLDDWNTIRSYHDFQNRMDWRDRQDARAKALRIHQQRSVPMR